MNRKLGLGTAICLMFGMACHLLGHSATTFAANPIDARQRALLQLAVTPDAAENVVTIQKQLAAVRKKSGVASTREVVVVGQIGGMPNVWPDQHPEFPWYAGQASFFLVDSKVASQFASHARQHGGDHNCAFCRSLAAKNAHAIAVVNLVDAKGEVIRTDARQLLKLAEGQTVVVRGTAKLLGGSLLVIDADQVQVNR